MTNEAKLTVADVTKRPATKPAMTEDGVGTGMEVTLVESVALANNGDVIRVPAGTLISQPLCGGFDGKLNANYSGCKIGTDGEEIVYRF
jgi:hypothetical protein